MFKRLLILVCLLSSLCCISSYGQSARLFKKALGGEKVTEFQPSSWFVKPDTLVIFEDSIHLNLDSILYQPRFIKKLMYHKLANLKPLNMYVCYLKNGKSEYVNIKDDGVYQKVTDFSKIYRKAKVDDLMEKLEIYVSK